MVRKAAVTTIEKNKAEKKMSVSETRKSKAKNKAIKKTVNKNLTETEEKTENLDLSQEEKAVRIVLKYPKTAAFVLGALLTAALPPYYQFWTMFLAFSGLMFLICGTNRLRKLCELGYWFGFGYFAVGFYWIGNALLIDVMQTGWLYPIVLLLNGAFFGLFTILPAAVTKYGRNIVSKMLLFAAVWCLSTEWLRSFLLTGFPWNPISSVLGFSVPMMQILSVLGTYGTSLLLVLTAVCPTIWLVDPRKYNTVMLFLPVAVCLGLWQFGEYILDIRPSVPDGNSIMVRLVQPSIPQTLKWNREVLEDNLQTYVNLSRQKDIGYVDFTIWGETAYPFDLRYDEKHKRKIAAAVPTYGYLITGFLRHVNDGYDYTPYNSFGVINTKGELVDWYDKNHLVPFGEYIPLRKYLPEWVRPIANTVAEFGRGEKYKTLRIGNYPMFAPLICYEVIFSDEVIGREGEHPTWAVVLTNDGWYGVSSGPYQHLVAAQMRAIEEGITIVRSANSGISALISAYGEIRAQIPLGERAAIDALVKPEEAHSTVFSRYGNRIPLAMSMMLILLALMLSFVPALQKNK